MVANKRYRFFAEKYVKNYDENKILNVVKP